jgi:HAD superfamily hydrolase (TIGR01509 family)
MIKLIIFDLDGVLVDIKNVHFDSLNLALNEVGEEFIISRSEHLSMFDGLKTYEKLKKITVLKGLSESSYEDIWKAKQKYTVESLQKIELNQEITSLIQKLSEDGYKIACCSNSIRRTVLTVLSKLGIIEYFDFILSNEDVENGKPHPEMYWRAISEAKCLAEETLIIEDSPYGLLAAQRSQSHVLRVRDSSEVTCENIFSKIMSINTNNKLMIPKWVDNKLNVLIPMAGAGSRFEKAGYTFPKPLVEVNGKPMIQVVVEALNIEANYIYIVQKFHRKKYNLDTLLNLITPNCTVLEVDGLTEGAACTALIAKDLINNGSPLFFANSDQYVDWNSSEFMYKMQETDCDGGIVTFSSSHPKWSYAKVDELGLVTEVAEKNPISDKATIGYYFWKKGSEFVKYAEQMIRKDSRVNGEFYVCPVFNEAIEDKKEIRTFHAENMWGLGTPEDLNYFIENYKKC